MLRRLSGLSADESLTDDAEALVGPASIRPDVAPQLVGWHAQVDFASRVTSIAVAAMGAVIAVLMLIGVFAAAFAGSDDLQMPARVTVTLAALIFAFAAAFRLPASVLRRQWIRTVLLFAAVVILGAVFALLAPSPGFRLPGEL